MYRYLALVCSATTLECNRRFRFFSTALLGKPAEWTIAYQGTRELVVHTAFRRGSAEACSLKNSCGVILGTLFNRQHSCRTFQPGVSFDERDTREIVASGGRHLVEQYWGSYVAIVWDAAGSKHHVFRDPTGNLPCYHTRHEGVDIFFSHIEDCVRLLPISFTVNRRYLARWLIYCGLSTRDTGMENVEDVLSGERLTLCEETITRSVLWNAAELARAPRFEEPEEAAKALRSAVQTAINAWASCYDNITLKLSGGLDSSIVAGCLAQAPSKPKITCLNFAIDVRFDQDRLTSSHTNKQTADKLRAITGNGDERYFAHLVAEHWKFPLVERERDLSMDLTRMWRVPLTIAPSMYFTAMEVDDAEIDFAKTLGVQASFSGQAGDSVLHATTQPLAAIDHAYLHGITANLWRHLLATSILSKESIWAVLKKTIKHGLLHFPYRSPFNLLEQPTLLKDDLTGTLCREDFESLWDKLTSPLPPGKRDHLTGLAGSAYYNYVFHAGKHIDHVDPLNSQPIWELMLQIPTYTVLAGGVSRGLARRAFADLLPLEIRKRQVKGSGGAFYQRVVRNNRDFLRETLLNGYLVRDGYLDRQKLENYFATEDPRMMISTSQVLSYIAAEVWLQQWAEIGQNSAAPASSLRAIT